MKATALDSQLHNCIYPVSKYFVFLENFNVSLWEKIKSNVDIFMSFLNRRNIVLRILPLETYIYLSFVNFLSPN